MFPDAPAGNSTQNMRKYRNLICEAYISRRNRKSASNFVHDGIQYITNSKTQTLRRGIYPAECFALSRTPCRLMHQVARFTSGKRYFA